MPEETITELPLEIDGDIFVKRTQLTLELMQETISTYEQTNSQTLFALIDDAELALKNADLTELQRERIRLYFFEGYTFEDIAEMQGKKYQAIQQSVNSAVTKIAEVYREWDYWTEGESYVPRAHQ